MLLFAFDMCQNNDFSLFCYLIFSILSCLSVFDHNDKQSIEIKNPKTSF